MDLEKKIKHTKKNINFYKKLRKDNVLLFWLNFVGAIIQTVFMIWHRNDWSMWIFYALALLQIFLMGASWSDKRSNWWRIQRERLDLMILYAEKFTKKK